MDTVFNFDNTKDENNTNPNDQNNIQNEYYTYIDSDLILHIENISNTVAMLYFTDDMENEIPIPKGLFVYSRDTNLTIQSPYKNKQFVLCWANNYVVKFNGETILIINSPRIWDITKM